MKEIEVKILEVDRKSIEKKLISIGAKKSFEKEMHFLCFDFKDGSLRKSGNLLRLRKEGDKAVLAFKGFIRNKGEKVVEETEVIVSDFTKTQTILEVLGLFVWLEMRKCRVTYYLGGAQFEFDKYTGKYSYIPEFMEIEAENAKTIHKYATILGFSKKECKPWDAIDLIKYYRKKRRKTERKKVRRERR